MQGEQHKGTLVTSEVGFLTITLALHCISLACSSFFQGSYHLRKSPALGTCSVLPMKYFVLSIKGRAGHGIAQPRCLKPWCLNKVFSSPSEASETIPPVLTRCFYTGMHSKHFFCMSCLRALYHSSHFLAWISTQGMGKVCTANRD